MLHFPGLRLIVVLAVIQLPMMAMSQDLASRGVRVGIHKILLGASDGDMELYGEGIDYIRNRQSHLKNMTFSSFELLPIFECNLLKALVVHKEKALLSDFLDMYERSHPGSPDGINFTYRLEDECVTEGAGYTLLDVAFIAYCQAVAKQELGQEELEIFTLLVDQGGELKMYHDYSDVISNILHRKKRCRKLDDVGSLQEADPSGCTLPANRPAPLITADVGQLLDIQEPQAELESGVPVIFNLDDSK